MWNFSYYLFFLFLYIFLLKYAAERVLLIYIKWKEMYKSKANDKESRDYW